MPGTRNTGVLALGGIAVAALLTVIGHLEVNDDLNPCRANGVDHGVVVPRKRGATV
ncbi:hypothetical protein O7614_05835 [Micromonospora sp. WMMD961]|uniref:hypothetical protein n=1 Tax=Micromonospora sp. WMMD961 TaxID=3016100 RepID=UPI00241783B5|nr:hypothetical protein [Micromonospora sp. WMMD961]MDG4779164.1 hypothetical protein [Micromonospora sp. WMMD961]